MSRIEFISRALAAARQRIATLISDVKAALTSSPPKPTPNLHPEASITSLEKDLYDILRENLKSVQTELEAEKSKAVEAATSRLEVEKLLKTSDTRIEALELEIASAHAETWEIAEKLSAEVAKHRDTEAALNDAKSKLSACQEHNQIFGLKYKQMKDSYDDDQFELLILRLNARGEKDRRDEAVQLATLEKDQQIVDMKDNCEKLAATNDSLNSNAQALSACNDEVRAWKEAHETTISELNATRDELTDIKRKWIAAEAEVATMKRMKEAFARFSSDMTRPDPRQGEALSE